ncbi:hypothetical protein CONPUDRAFT_82534 [Coniophora puteana RWD-64-598 SS2]|uniref:Uncharacterized protein n=1 Tax=Coniophora puteana (strain RWD-64-598) TaxID=741705 RepID=A0A5M3MMA9_CONPW|nr:uncharacterized protein CONPUDRAFT_82534 [Coniophora puteana RWD-64-598 SS2]EIW80167.1 hypothetical protein CONPUDRAFT_82534 [Coniophora puteana RWD-64-598 SS2]
MRLMASVSREGGDHRPRGSGVPPGRHRLRGRYGSPQSSRHYRAPTPPSHNAIAHKRVKDSRIHAP